MSRLLGAFGPAFVGVAFLCVPGAGIATFVAYELWNQPGWSIGAGVAVGLASGLATWTVYSSAYRSARAVYPEQYHELLVRLRTAEALLDASPARGDPCATAARTRADELRRMIADWLDTEKGEAVWISAAGYLQAWTWMYRLEEAAVELVAAEEVLAMARDDVQRLSGSSIDERDGLSKRLEGAIQNLLAARAPAASPSFGADEVSIRADVAAVRNKINRYREDQWAGLVAERNMIMLATAIAGVIAYLALVIVVFRHVAGATLLVAASFLITGALVSLLHQATVVGSREGLEDFGHSTARLLSATFVSGVVAVVGVVVVEGSGLAINGAPIVPSFSHWAQVFDWTANRSGYFFAALFGFAPSLLFQILQGRADAIKDALRSTRAAGGTATGK